MGQKLIISSDFGYISNMLTVPSIIYVHKKSCSFRISSQYFSKMLLVLRHQASRPIPSKKSKITFKTFVR